MNTRIHVSIPMICSVVFFFCAASLSVLAQEPLAHPAHPKRMLLKIKAQSALEAEVQALKAALPMQSRKGDSEVGAVWNIGEIVGQQSAPMLSLAHSAGIQTLQQLCPNLDLTNKEAYQCGLDRIYVAECRTGYEAQSVLQTLTTSKALALSLEYAEPDYIGSGGGVFAGEANTVAKNNEDGGVRKNTTAKLQSLTPNDPYFSVQWGLQNTGQRVGSKNGKIGADANLTAAWSLTQGVDSIIVAILDSGQPIGAAAMPDFAGRLLPGYDYVNNDADPTDDHGHGSNVMSIATAKGNNGAGIAGVNWNCKILPVKILNSSNSGQYSWWINGVRFAVDKGAKVLNMSVGGSGLSNALWDAIIYAHSKGAIVVVCMMNTNNNVPYYPAAFPESIAVGAINNVDERAVPFCFSATSGSNFGSHLHVVAPGEQISGYRNTDGAVTNWCGTSQATPIVSGIVSLMLGVQPTLTFDEIRTILKNTAADRIGLVSEDTQGWDMYYGWGRVNAAAAVQAALALRQMSAVQESSGLESFLETIYPNPTSDEATFALKLYQSAHVKLTVYTMLGSVLHVVADSTFASGQHNFIWRTLGLPNGAYGYRLEVGGVVRSGFVSVVR